MRKLAVQHKKILPIFVLFFAIAGTLILLSTRAASETAVSIEPEDGTLQSGANITDDSNASNARAVEFTSQATATVKPQIKGAVDRDGYDTSKGVSSVNLEVPSNYQAIVNNFVLMVDWSKLQPAETTLDTSVIDDAIAEAKAKGMHIKLRILAGIHSPAWVKNLEGGPFDVYDIDGTTGEEFVGTSPKYWTDAFKTAYSNLMSGLAAKYENEDTLSSVVNSMCTTIFAEPFIRNLDEGNNMTTYYGAGLTTDLDKQCQNDAIDIHNTHWKRTRTETALNPLAYKGTDSSGNVVEKFDPDFTISWVQRCRQILGERCVMGNNGFNATSLGLNLRKVIGEVICQGNPPQYFQTRQNSVIISTGHTLAEVLQYAVDTGAGMVEMPVQYRTTAITTEDLAPYDSALEANSVIACPADRLLPNPT